MVVEPGPHLGHCSAEVCTRTPDLNKVHRESLPAKRAQRFTRGYMGSETNVASSVFAAAVLRSGKPGVEVWFAIVRQADVVDDQLALARRDDVANSVLDRLEDLLSLFDAVPAGARAWSWICPPSMAGKKSRPTKWDMTAPKARSAAAENGTMIPRVSQAV